MRQFLVSSQAIHDSRVSIQGPAFHHLSRVLRLKPGAKIVVADETGRRFNAVLRELGSQNADAELLESLSPAPARARVRLAVCLTKGPAFEEVLDLATQLGADEFFPLVSSRSVVKIPPGGQAAKLARWEKIIGAASQQSNRSDVPLLHAPRPLLEAAPEFNSGTCLWAWERETQALSAVLAGVGSGGPFTVLVGPEGGFAPEEAASLKSLGALSVGLGPLILRTPVACAYLLSALGFWFSQESGIPTEGAS